VHRAQIARQQKEFATARDLLSRELERANDDPQLRDLLALVLIELPDTEQKKRALQLAAANYQAMPHVPRAKMTKGWVLFRLGQREKGFDLLREAAAADANPESLYYAGVAADALGHNEQAANIAKQLREAIDRPIIFALRPEARRWLRARQAQDVLPDEAE